ncbi:MAG: hypothetical protein ACI9LX_001464 [Paraglaciecola sp.]|jgi:hypothetical protein
MVLRFILLVSINLLVACGSFASSNPNYVVLEENDLVNELKETSGLYCPQIGSAFTINDSGNKSIIFKIDSSGQIINKKLVSAKNKDWEAITGDSQYFYIGDVGNNNGKRKFVQIHIVPKLFLKKLTPKKGSESTTYDTSLSLFYINNSINKNEYLNHDYDAETLINLDDSLFLFSKSWNSGTLFIYQLNKIEATQYVEPVSEIMGLPGVITGGDFDRKNNQFILVGYKLNGMGGFSPFMAILNRNFSLQKSFALSGYGQVEGMCVAPNGEVWFTQESSFFSDHKMVKLKLTK